MSIPLAEALAQVDLEPGRVYRCAIKGRTVEVRVLEEVSGLGPDEHEPFGSGPLPGPVEPIHPILLRQIRQKREWLSHGDNWEKYAGQVVILCGAEVLGHGPDDGVAVRMAEANLAARPEGERPGHEDLASLRVPHRFIPEGPLP
jgi:hypothetical protein